MVWLLRASIAIYGLSIAITLLPRLQRPARPGALPSPMAAAGLDPSSVMWQFALLVALPVIFAIAGERLLRIATSKRWVAASFAIALASAPLTLMHYGNLRHLVLHGVFGGVILGARRIEPRFGRVDVVLIPTFLSTYFAFLDTGFGKTPAATFLRAAMVVFALRLIVGAISRRPQPGIAFAAAPLAFLAQLQLLAPFASGVIAIAWILITPIALTYAPIGDRRLHRFRAWIAYPLIAAAYPLALLGIASAPSLDFFEDGHSLLTASEMARGEVAYRDVIPLHGFVSDALIDLGVIKAGRAELGAILMTRRVAGALTVSAIYALALAATTSADLALLATFLSLALFPASTIWLRVLPALLAVAALVTGTRLRSRKWFAIAGALVVLGLLFSLDVGICSLVVAIFAAIRSRAFVPLLIGVASVLVPALLLFAIGGFAVDFVRVTLFEVLTAGSIYTVGPLSIPHCLQTLGSLADLIDQPECLANLLWFVALIAVAVLVARSPFRARRRDAVALIALWIVFAGVAYVTRRHYYFAFALAPLLVAGIAAIPRRALWGAIVITVYLALIARPFVHIFDIASPLRRSGGVPAKATNPPGIPRARGAVIDAAAAAALPSVQRFLATLRPNETFFDFANAATLYYLFDRDCPVRQMGVPIYQREDRQREVIAALERNRNVRAVLIAFPHAGMTVDEIPNAERAPLVWRYLQAHFRPQFEENGVVFWVR